MDFYDGSILYDFQNDVTTICDIDLFEKAPVINDKGVDWFGTKRLKAPEEYMQGCIIDEQTNIFTLGALIFDFFGEFSEEEIQKMTDYVPCRSTYAITEKLIFLTVINFPSVAASLYR